LPNKKNLHPGLQARFFTSGFTNNTLYAFIFSPIYVTCPAPLILFIILIITFSPVSCYFQALTMSAILSTLKIDSLLTSEKNFHTHVKQKAKFYSRFCVCYLRVLVLSIYNNEFVPHSMGCKYTEQNRHAFEYERSKI